MKVAVVDDMPAIRLSADSSCRHKSRRGMVRSAGAFQNAAPGAETSKGAGPLMDQKPPKGGRSTWRACERSTPTGDVFCQMVRISGHIVRSTHSTIQLALERDTPVIAQQEPAREIG